MTVAADPETAEWLDGPMLVEWLEKMGFVLTQNAIGWHHKPVRKWRNGSRAQVYAVDRLLSKLGVHLSELPHECWVR